MKIMSGHICRLQPGFWWQVWCSDWPSWQVRHGLWLSGETSETWITDRLVVEAVLILSKRALAYYLLVLEWREKGKKSTTTTGVNIYLASKWKVLDHDAFFFFFFDFGWYLAMRETSFAATVLQRLNSVRKREFSSHSSACLFIPATGCV